MTARTIVVLVAAVSVMVGAASASAQQCADGRVANRGTQGRCCWPGQRWSARYGRCDGPPSCPDGMDAFGDDCIETVAREEPARMSFDVSETENAPTVATAVGATVTNTSGWPSTGGTPPEGSLNPRSTTTADSGFIALGLSTWFAGYGVGVGESVYFFERPGTSTTVILDHVAPQISIEGRNRYDSTCPDTAGALALIPIAGPLLALGSADDCRTLAYAPVWGRDGAVTHLVITPHDRYHYDYDSELVVGLAITSTALQLAGAIFTLIGAFAHHTAFEFDDPSRIDLGGGTEVAVMPLAGAGAVGLRLELTHL